MKNLLLSIDGSTKATGVGLFDLDTKELVDYTVFKKDSKQEPDMRKRVMYMVDCVSQYIKGHKVKKIVMEQVIPAINNSSTVLALGILQGGILGVAHSFNIPIDFITVPYWHGELGITKSNGDLKEQSIKWVNDRYGTNFKFYSPKSSKNEDDVCDAIALGSVYLGSYEPKKKKLQRKR